MDIKRVSNTAKQPPKSVQLQAGRSEGKPKSMLQLYQNQRENKIKKPKLPCWLNYKKAIAL